MTQGDAAAGAGHTKAGLAGPLSLNQAAAKYSLSDSMNTCPSQTSLITSAGAQDGIQTLLMTRNVESAWYMQ